MSAPILDGRKAGAHVGTDAVPRQRSWLILGVVLLATFVINLDTTIVNVALPALSTQLHSTTSGLQWVVDAYNLTFAGLILTGGTIGDRYGRRRTLTAGLTVFAAGSAIAAYAGDTGSLIGWRVLMGAAAAFVFPTTLSIIAQTYPDRASRAKAIGAWGASTGIAVALGPIVGGELLEHFWWGSIFIAMVPVAALTAVAAIVVVPSDRPHEKNALDLIGLSTSIVALTSLVYTIIEAPDHGWTSATTVAGFTVAACAFGALVVAERRQRHPMLDVTLFANLRFTAATAAVTLTFFALSGFVFLIVLYFQIMRGYSPLDTGIRILPVAVSIALSSGVGTLLAVRVGNKVVVATGLLLVATGYAWVALIQSAHTSYWLIVGQMIFLGVGMGLSTTPATEAILGVVKPAQAGIGSAVNDATRLVGATLGVAVIGSIYSSRYTHALTHATHVPAAALHAASASYGASRSAAAHLPPTAAHDLLTHADNGFLSGLHAGCAIAALTCVIGAAVVTAFLPAHPTYVANPAPTSDPAS